VNIKTKYNIGDDVFLMKANEIVKDKIVGIVPAVFLDEKVIVYYIINSLVKKMVKLHILEDDIHPTKESLLKKLSEEIEEKAVKDFWKGERNN